MKAMGPGFESLKLEAGLQLSKPGSTGVLLNLVDDGTTPIYHSLELNRPLTEPLTEQNRFNQEMDKRLHPDE